MWLEDDKETKVVLRFLKRGTVMKSLIIHLMGEDWAGGEDEEEDDKEEKTKTRMEEEVYDVSSSQHVRTSLGK